MKFPASLRQSLTLHFVAVAVLPILLLGVFGIQYVEHKHLETVSTLLDAHALDVSREASEFLQDTSASLSLVEKTLNSGLLQNDAEINQYLQMAINELNNFESIYLLNKDFRVAHLGLSADNTDNREDYLGLDFSAHEIFTQHSQLSGQVWSNTFLSTITVEPSITLGIPLEDGILLGTVSLKKLSAELAERLEQTRGDFQFSLLDHHGVLIADSQSGLTSQRLNLRLHPEVRGALDHKIEVASKLHEDGSLLESIHLVPETGWAAFVRLPMQKAMVGVAPLRYLLITSLTFAAFLGVALAFWLSRRMLRPILLLRDATRAVAKGDYEQPLQTSIYEELEDLSGSFREMIVAVEEREQSISDNRARYRNLVNSIDGIVWELDLAEFRFTFVSNQAEQILGYPAQQWLDDKDFWPQHVYEDDRDWVLNYCGTETKALRDHDFEYRMIAADGRLVWLKDIASVVVEDGLPVRLRGVMLDITKRKEAELHLVETTERLQLLLDRMPFGCVMWNAENLVELWNPAAEEIFGFTQKEVLGLHPHEFLVSESVQKETSRVFERLKNGDPIAHSINDNITKDGRSISCEWHNTPLQNPDGSTKGVISMVQDISQRLSAENALRQSEVSFRAVFQTNPDAVLITRVSDGHILNVNDHCLSMSGYTREEMIGKSTLDIGLWMDSADRDRFLSLVSNEGFVENFEMSMRTKIGRVRIGLSSTRTLVLNDEPCLLTVVRDITEMKEAEGRMARSEARFRSLISVMGDGLMILGYNGEIVQCNQTAERIMGMKTDDLIGKLHNELILEAIHEDGTSYALEEHPAASTLRTGEPVTNQIMGIVLADGQTVWLQVNTHALGLDKAGKPVAVVATFADVTRLKNIETELRVSENHMKTLSMQFQGVLEAIPDRIMILDAEMRVVWLNWFEDGIDPEEEYQVEPVCCHELSGVSCSPLAGLVALLCDNCPVKRAFASGRTESEQVEMSDGRTLALRVFPVFNELGAVVNVIVISQDITESLRHQAQAMRTGQLAALGELAAGVAHEINNPINGVINYAQLILNKAIADSREQELSQRIIKESERVATIVRELLFFAREESQEVNRTTISDALSEVLALTQNQLNKEGVQLQIQLPEELPGIVSRSHQIQQLFLNLISNARHALTEKYPDMNLDKILLIKGEEILKDDQPFVRVVFRDHGVGIDAELLPRVMNPFTTTKSSKEGTGLGLSISHEIVLKHGGTIAIDSVRGEFTEIIIELPAEK